MYLFSSGTLYDYSVKQTLYEKLCLYGDQKEVNIQTQKVQMDPNGK